MRQLQNYFFKKNLRNKIKRTKITFYTEKILGTKGNP